MRTSFFLVVGTALAALAAFVACGTPDPNYGDPGGIIGKKLPSEPGGTSAPGAEDKSPFKDTTSNPPVKTFKAAHAAANAPAAEAVPECLGCHGKAGAGATTKWTFAGRVVNAGAGVKDVDVIVAKDAVKVGPVKSDADGFFWAPIALGDVPEGSRAYIRKGTTVTTMNPPLEAVKGGGCGIAPACHGANGLGGPITAK